MSLSILIPVRGFAEGKSRLSALLSREERAILCRRFLDHVLAVATDARMKADVHVVSPSPEVRRFARDRGALVHDERAPGHNPALEAAMRDLPPHRPVLILNMDLPMLRVEDLLAMVEQGAAADMVIAPDEAGEGTNALLLARPSLVTMRFGCGSCAAHLADAALKGLRSGIVRRPGLATDIDLPEHLKKIAACA